MQTSLADFIRDTPEGREADAILRKCVHCGFCTATCPTYQLLGDELDSPRGRIYLIKQALEGCEITAQTQLHLDRCLTCRACETTCPSGVEYGRLADIGRKVVEERVPRSPWQAVQRAVLSAVLPRTQVFGALLALGRLVRPLMPRRLAEKVPDRGEAAGAWPAPRHARRMLVLAGCVQPALAPAINAAAARVLDRLGISLIEVEAAGCCGAVRFHMNRQEAGKMDARALIDTWWPQVDAGAEAIVMTASGCGTMVKEFGHLLKDDPAYAAKAARISALTRDLAEVLGSERAGLEKLVAGGRLGEGEDSLPFAVQPPARPADSRRCRGTPRCGGIRADPGAGCAPVLRVGGHLFDPAAGPFATPARQQAGRAAHRVTAGNRNGQHRLPHASAVRNIDPGRALDPAARGAPRPVRR